MHVKQILTRCFSSVFSDVARMECKAIREKPVASFPDCAALHPGYETKYPKADL
jgi:hypothetical protein